ncbi:TMEM175 family protein [Aequorivita capsosiphonis]|uniref:TMEM175 family protein n=1 Tax=Aequorivita capsosiphonis TaxID=487317 RepID=UPI0003FABC82|nr:TMEM175 family protein [Aequorivita capsosiphonis]
MRSEFNKYRKHDSRINYRGLDPSRMDNLTDAVFGIAITLLIFNLTNPNSFTDLLTFTKTLPAFLLSIFFLVIIWKEHLRFSEVYTLNSTGFIFLNTLFIALVIFYVYPLRFLSLFLTSIFFNVDVGLVIEESQLPYLMIYYGFVAFALNFVLFLFYYKAYRIRENLNLSTFEIFYTKSQMNKLIIMFAIPLISIIMITFIMNSSSAMATAIGGSIYFLYGPAIFYWSHNYSKKSKKLE